MNESIARVHISGSTPSPDCDSVDVTPFAVLEGDIISACLPSVSDAGTLDIVAYSERHQIYELASQRTQSCGTIINSVDLQHWNPTGTGHVMQLYLETSK